jgi:hypothetical protein
VTRADFTNLAEGLSKDISKLIRDKHSVMTASTEASAMQCLKEELIANRKQQEITNNALQLMQTMMTQFMNTQVQRTQPPPVSQSAHSAPFSASSIHDTNTSQDPRAPHSPLIDSTPVFPQYDVPPFSSGLIKSQRRVTIKNAPVGDDPEHPTPTSTGATPPPKKSRGTNATLLQRQLDDSFANATTNQETTNSEGARCKFIDLCVTPPS